VSKPELELTPAHGKHTLFVTGEPDPVRTMSEVFNNSAQHVHFHTYNPDGSQEYFERWYEVVFQLLKDGVWVTIDIPVHHITSILESGYTEYNNFIPLIMMDLPYIDQLGYNAVVRVQDTNTQDSWYHYVHDLRNREQFIPGSKRV
jgi:hypothetical protein